MLRTMGEEDDEDVREPLLIDFIAEKVGVGKLAGILPGHIDPAYILAFLGPFLDIGVIDVYRYIVAGKPMFVQRPQLLITLAGMVFGVYGIHWMRDAYADAGGSLRAAEKNGKSEFTEEFETIVSFRTKLYVWGISLVLSLFNAFFILGIPEIIDAEGVIGAFVLNVISGPLVFLPIIIEFAFLYFGIHVLLPQKILNANPKLFFYDSRQMGGLGKVGSLFKHSYYLYSTGLLMYSLLFYGPQLAGEFAVSLYPEIPDFVTISFLLLWGLGVISIASSMYFVHRLISLKKDEEFGRINEHLHEKLDNPYDIDLNDPPNQTELDQIQYHLEKVRSTREYSSTFTTLTQIGISAILPQVLNILTQATLVST